MRKVLLLIILVMIFPLSLIGCSQTVFSDDLIYNPSDIDQIGVGMVTGENMATQNNINDKDIINQIVGFLKGISVQELTEDQTRDIFEDWSTKVKYDLTLISIEEISGADPRVGVKGFVTILNDGNMMFVEPKTIGPLTILSHNNSPFIRSTALSQFSPFNREKSLAIYF